MMRLVVKRCMTIRALAVSDQIDPRIHSSSLKERMPDVRIVFGCGDIPARYLEFLADALDRPVYFVLGNHLEELTRLGEGGKHYEPMGCVDIGGKVVRDSYTGLILAGLPGSPKYTDMGTEQYSEWELTRLIIRMTPKLLWNKVRHGRALDVLITHSPARDINDRDDPPHRGFKIMRKFLHWFKPAYQLHGHVHLYDRSEPFTTEFEETTVINVYPYHVLDLDPPAHEVPPDSPLNSL
jgi:Icc-related predicted phosphoesterase